MDIWNYYIQLFSNENPLVITGIILVTIAVFTFLLNYFFKPIVSPVIVYISKKIRIKTYTLFLTTKRYIMHENYISIKNFKT
jgi:hypothetical protein